MTIKELIALLQEQDPEAKVYRATDDGPLVVQDVRFDPQADSRITGFKQSMRSMMAWKNGEEITVEVPNQEPIWAYTPGVVIE